MNVIQQAQRQMAAGLVVISLRVFFAWVIPAIQPAAFLKPVFQCGILSAAEIVNDTLLRIRSKTVEIELLEAEFDVDFFAFG